MDLAEKKFERAARFIRVLQSQLTILPGLHKDNEMEALWCITSTQSRQFPRYMTRK